MDIKEHLKILNTENELFPELYRYAVTNRIPIIDNDSLHILKQLIRITKRKRILEIGTAIGYSGLHILSLNEDITLTTVEKNQKVFEIANNNFEKYGVKDRVTALLGDAKEIEINEAFDLVFIDASKGNNQLFFEKFSELLIDDGIVIVDNILLRGQILKENIENKNKRKLRNKVNDFNHYISKKYPNSMFLNVGDGLLVITK